MFCLNFLSSLRQSLSGLGVSELTDSVPVVEPFEEPRSFQEDDAYYPITTLMEYMSAGMDITGLKEAHSMEGLGMDGGRMPLRGIQVSNDWDVLAPSGKIGTW